MVKVAELYRARGVEVARLQVAALAMISTFQ
jgi:hypothetical protein